eukprot:15366951-Ditylum_brightwellii.AAC.1
MEEAVLEYGKWISTDFKGIASVPDMKKIMFYNLHLSLDGCAGGSSVKQACLLAPVDSLGMVMCICIDSGVRLSTGAKRN